MKWSFCVLKTLNIKPLERHTLLFTSLEHMRSEIRSDDNTLRFGDGESAADLRSVRELIATRLSRGVTRGVPDARRCAWFASATIRNMPRTAGASSLWLKTGARRRRTCALTAGGLSLVKIHGDAHHALTRTNGNTNRTISCGRWRLSCSSPRDVQVRTAPRSRPGIESPCENRAEPSGTERPCSRENRAPPRTIERNRSALRAPARSGVGMRSHRDGLIRISRLSESMNLNFTYCEHVYSRILTRHTQLYTRFCRRQF